MTIIYTKPDCQACYATKAYLKRNNVAYTEIDVSDEVAAKVLSDRGFTTLPVVITDDGVAWCGFRIDKLKGLTRDHHL